MTKSELMKMVVQLTCSILSNPIASSKLSSSMYGGGVDIQRLLSEQYILLVNLSGEIGIKIEEDVVVKDIAAVSELEGVARQFETMNKPGSAKHVREIVQRINSSIQGTENDTNQRYSPI